MNKRSVLKVLLNFGHINRYCFLVDLIISALCSFIVFAFYCVCLVKPTFTLHQFLLGMVTAPGGALLALYCWEFTPRISSATFRGFNGSGAAGHQFFVEDALMAPRWAVSDSNHVSVFTLSAWLSTG